jgi:peptidyl-prolyl cis-trans isomerase B (cyclophilin B)
MKLFFRYLAPLFFTLISFTAYAEGGNVLPKVKLSTSHGDIVIELNADKAPNTVANFLSYVEADFYNGTIFHRVIKDFMVQGGGFDANFEQKTVNDPIENEANNGLTNVRGSLAMARTGDPHSATAQFFINTVDNDFLNFRAENRDAWGYAVFAHVVEGMDVVDEIRAVSTGSKGHHQDVPTDDVVINSATVID